MRALELFAGIGGCATALRDLGCDDVVAVDQDRRAEVVYRAWFDHPHHPRNLVHLKPDWFAAHEADLWWMSPPCQPYTIRGNQRDLDDPRSGAFRNVCRAVQEVRPRHLGLENVPWFSGSRGHALLRSILDDGGYEVREWAELCPTSLGVPNVRRRFYLIASLDPLDDPVPIDVGGRLPDYLDAQGPDLPASVKDRFGDALHIVNADDPDAVAACFTSAYGRSPVYAGSYLRQRGRLRCFSPAEIARLLHLPALPEIDDKTGWKLVGNSLSTVAVRHVLSTLSV